MVNSTWEKWRCLVSMCAVLIIMGGIYFTTHDKYEKGIFGNAELEFYGMVTAFLCSMVLMYNLALPALCTVQTVI